VIGLANASVPLRQRRRAAGVAAVLVAATAIALPNATVKLDEIGPFLPIFLTLACGADALTAYLLFSQARVGRSWSLLALGFGYLYSAAIIVPHILTFPNVFTPTGLLGATPQTAVWFWVWWHAGFPLFVLLYVIADRVRATREERRVTVALLAAGITCVIAIVSVLLSLTIAEAGALPVIIEKGRYGLLVSTGIGPAVLAIITLALGTLAATTRLRNVTHLWLAVALVATLCDCTLTLFAGGRYTVGWYVARLESLVASIVVLLTYLGMIATMFDQLSRLSHIDGLTGLSNRRSFDETFEQQSTIATRTKAPLSLLMLDVDWFKSFNDTYGHPRGDEALRTVAACIADTLPRRSDLAARYGGEEFVVILPGTDRTGAAIVAERIRASVEGCGVPHAASTFGHLTVSVGVATSTDDNRDAAYDALLSRADAALYAAKHGGRNAVTT
jgi:diguanylate cyclase (GGDEF)-like protein